MPFRLCAFSVGMNCVISRQMTMAVNKSMSYIEGVLRQTISYPVVSIIKNCDIK